MYFDMYSIYLFFFFQAEDGIRDLTVTGVQTCALPICFAVGEHVAHRMDERQIDAATAERLDDPRVVGRDEGADPDPGDLGEGLGEGVARLLERGRIAGRREDQRERRLVAGARDETAAEGQRQADEQESGPAEHRSRP